MISENIKVSEVSDVLRKQLEGIDTRVQLDEIGTVLQVSDGVARIYGLRNAEANELLEFENGIKAIVMNLEEDNVGAVLLGPTDRIKEGFTVKRTKRIASIMVGESMLGRVIDPLGAPLDGKGLIGGELCEMPLERKAPGVIFRQPVNQPLQTGLKAVDAMIPIGRGQRELIIGDRQTGKTAIAIDTIINQRANYEAGDPVYCIYVAIGQKGSTVATIVNTLRQYGAMDYTIVVAATAGDPAALQYYAPFAGAAIGEYFRDTGRHALVVYDHDDKAFLDAGIAELAVRQARNFDAIAYAQFTFLFFVQSFEGTAHDFRPVACLDYLRAALRILQFDGECLLASVTIDRNLHLVARTVFANLFLQGMAGLHLRPIDGDNHVAQLDAGSFGRALLGKLGNVGSFGNFDLILHLLQFLLIIVRCHRIAQPVHDVVHANHHHTQHRTLDSPVLLQILRHFPGNADRYGE